MRKAVKIMLSEYVTDTSDTLHAMNEKNEVYIPLAQLSQFSFGDMDFRFMFAGFNITDCFIIEFTKEGMGEYHRIKREVEEYMGLQTQS
jgi:hypothetical protein